MINRNGISFDEFIQNIHDLPQLNAECSIIHNDNPYLPIENKQYLQVIAVVEKADQHIMIKANLIYDNILNIPSFYYLLQCLETSKYILLSDYLEDKSELQYFVQDVQLIYIQLNPITGISMNTMHNCMLPEFIEFVRKDKENNYVLPLLAYYLSKVHFYLKVQ